MHGVHVGSLQALGLTQKKVVVLMIGQHIYNSRLFVSVEEVMSVSISTTTQNSRRWRASLLAAAPKHSCDCHVICSVFSCCSSFAPPPPLLWWGVAGGGWRSLPLRNLEQKPTETSKQPIRTRYLGHLTGYQPIRDQYFLIRSVPDLCNESINVSILQLAQQITEVRGSNRDNREYSRMQLGFKIYELLITRGGPSSSTLPSSSSSSTAASRRCWLCELPRVKSPASVAKVPPSVARVAMEPRVNPPWVSMVDWFSSNNNAASSPSARVSSPRSIETSPPDKDAGGTEEAPYHHREIVPPPPAPQAFTWMPFVKRHRGLEFDKFRYLAASDYWGHHIARYEELCLELGNEVFRGWEMRCLESKYNTYYFQQYVLNTRANMYLIRIKYVLARETAAIHGRDQLQEDEEEKEEREEEETGPYPNTALPRIATVIPCLLKQIPVPVQLCHELLLYSPAFSNRSLSQYSSAKNCYCVPPSSKTGPCPITALPRIATVFLRLLKQVPVPLQLCHELLLSLSHYSSATNCYCVPPSSKTGPCPITALPRIATVFLRLLKQVPVPLQLCHEFLCLYNHSYLIRIIGINTYYILTRVALTLSLSTCFKDKIYRQSQLTALSLFHTGLLVCIESRMNLEVVFVCMWKQILISILCQKLTEISWLERIEVAMAKNALSSYLFSSNLKLQTRFKTLRNTVSQIRDIISENLENKNHSTTQFKRLSFECNKREVSILCRFAPIGPVGATLWASQNAVFGKKRTKTYYCFLACAAGGGDGHLCACQRSDINDNLQEPTETSKQPIRTRYLGHVTGYQPMRDYKQSIRTRYLGHVTSYQPIRGQCIS
eukprot:sb/3462078/